jgi:hypothetical protein
MIFHPALFARHSLWETLLEDVVQASRIGLELLVEILDRVLHNCMVQRFVLVVKG